MVRVGVALDLSVMLADRGEAIADPAVRRDQSDVFGPVASDATAWRVLSMMDKRMPARVHAAPGRRPAAGMGPIGRIGGELPAAAAAAGHAEAVDAARRARTGLLVDAGSTPEPVPRRALKPRAVPRLRRLGFSAASLRVTAAAAVAALALETAGPGTGETPGGVAVQDPAAALHKATLLTSAASDQSGKAAVRATKDGRPWGGKTVNWNSVDIVVVDDAPPRHAGPRLPGRGRDPLRAEAGGRQLASFGLAREH